MGLIENLLGLRRSKSSGSGQAFLKWWDNAGSAYDHATMCLDAFLAGMQYSADQLNEELAKGDGRHEVVEKKG